MAQLCKAAMAARVGLGHLLDNFEDTPRPSSLSPRFRRVPVDGCRRIFAARLLIPRSNPSPKGGLEPPQKWVGPVRLGRPAQGIFGPFRAHLSRAGFSCNCELLSSRLCGLLTSLSVWIVRMSCHLSLYIFRPSPRSFVPSHCGPWVIWSHVHLEYWLVPGFMIFSQSAHWSSTGGAPFSA
jgi:hypothetical protein